MKNKYPSFLWSRCKHGVWLKKSIYTVWIASVHFFLQKFFGRNDSEENTASSFLVFIPTCIFKNTLISVFSCFLLDCPLTLCPWNKFGSPLQANCQAQAHTSHNKTTDDDTKGKNFLRVRVCYLLLWLKKIVLLPSCH